MAQTSIIGILILIVNIFFFKIGSYREYFFFAADCKFIISF